MTPNAAGAEYVTMDAQMVEHAVNSMGQAIEAYGIDVFKGTEHAAATETVKTGLRLLERWRKGKRAAPEIEQAVSDIADDPANPDFYAVLRVLLTKAMAADPDLASDLAALAGDSPVKAAPITASGERAIAIGSNSGIAATGDGNTFSLPGQQ